MVKKSEANPSRSKLLYPHAPMKIIVSPGMDGGNTLSARFRAQLEPSHLVLGHTYASDIAESYQDLTAQVRALIEQAQQPTILVAESFSGPIAIQLAADPPEHLAGVALIATFAHAPRWRGFAVMGPLLFRIPPPKIALRRFLLDAHASPAQVAAVLRAIRTPSPAVLSLRLREIMRVDVRAALSQPKVPTLVVRARNDRLIPQHRGLPSPTDEIEAPHLVLCARPNQAASLVTEFIRRCR